MTGDEWSLDFMVNVLRIFEDKNSTIVFTFKKWLTTTLYIILLHTPLQNDRQSGAEQSSHIFNLIKDKNNKCLYI